MHSIGLGYDLDEVNLQFSISTAKASKAKPSPHQRILTPLRRCLSQSRLLPLVNNLTNVHWVKWFYICNKIKAVVP